MQQQLKSTHTQKFTTADHTALQSVTESRQKSSDQGHGLKDYTMSPQKMRFA